MDGQGNVFDNSAAITPLLEGQGLDAGAGDNLGTVDATPPDEGQGEGGQETTTGWQAEFESPEKMYEALTQVKKSYDNLRPQYTKASMELSELKKNYTQQTTATPPEATTPEDMLLNKIQEIVAPVKAQNDELMMQNTVSKLIAEHPDFLEHAPEVQKYLADNPELWSVKNPIETVYKIVKADKVAGSIGQIANETKAKLYADKEIKVLNSLDTKTPVNNMNKQEPSPEDAIKSEIMSVYGRKNSIF